MAAAEASLRMNRKQKVAIVVGGVVVLVLALFPPSVHTRSHFRPARTTLSLSGPEWVFGGSGRIDHGSLYNLQLTALVLTVAAVLVLKDRNA